MPIGHAKQGYAQKVANVVRGQRLHIFVTDPVNAIFLGQQKHSLEVQTGGLQDGLKVSAATGPVEVNWVGEIWVVGDAPNVPYSYSVEY
jgi:hypothetical protein